MIARAVFARDADKIYQQRSKRLLAGDHRVFQALANRAFGMPKEETGFDQEKPFRLVIEYLGCDRPPEVIEAKPARGGKCLTDRDKDEGE